MPAPFVRLSLGEFADLLTRFQFTRQVVQVHMHHTFQPNHRSWRGLASVQAMRDFHVATNGWSDIAQHVTIAPDGGIWTGRSWNRAPASSSGFNGNGTVGPFMFETVGNFDRGFDRPEGAQLEAVLEVIARVQHRFGLAPDTLRFHRQLNSPKSCPGTGVDFDAILDRVQARREAIALEAGTRELIPGTPGDGPFAPAAMAVSQLLRSLGSGVADATLDSTGAEPADSGLDAQAITALTSDQGDTRAAPPRDGSMRDAARGAPALTPEMLNALRPHVVNLSQGEFSRAGRFRTEPGDVDAIFHEHLPRARAEASTRGEPLRVVFVAHGGLVDEESGLRIAHGQAEWWKANQVYPIFFTWETGLMATIEQLLGGSRRELPRAAARDLWDFTTDPLIETTARALGGVKIWGGMKWSAERASAPGGGARYVAERLAEFLDAAPADGGAPVELHAVGHSAGSIFLAHFVNALLEEEPGARIQTLSLLAPAVRVDTFQDRLAQLIGPDRPIASCTLFTMARDFEEADSCGKVYRKSLLCLVSRALESQRDVPILGLETSLRADARMRRLFGLDGAPGSAEVVWSMTKRTEGRVACTANAHGAFDNDAPTMNAVLRRVLGADDAASLVGLPAAVVAARAFTADGVVLPPELDFVRALDSTLSAAEPSFASAAAPLRDAVPTASPFAGFEGGNGAHGAHAGDVASASGDYTDLPDLETHGASDEDGATRTTGRRRALCIGIDDYPDAPLAGCVADARAWASTLQRLGFAVAGPLVNGTATRRAILDALQTMIAGSRAGDVLVFQFAGHGTQVPDVDGDDDGDGKDEALVPVDYGSGAFVIDDDLRHVIGQLPKGVNLTCFIDCCHSGTVTRVFGRSGGEPELPPGTRARFLKATPALKDAHRAFREAHPTPRVPRARREAMREVAFSACRPEEVAYESNGHGDFTVRATKILRAGIRGLTHAAFQKAVVSAFGASPRQRPVLDCAPASETRGLLAPVAGARPADADGAPAPVSAPAAGAGYQSSRVDLARDLRRIADQLTRE